jgi:hypothetical protein
VVPSQTSVRVQRSPSLQARPLRGAQVPSTAAPAALLHAWQSPVFVPPQASLQHTPSTQLPDLQSVRSLQALPLSSRPHLPDRHFRPAAH